MVGQQRWMFVVVIVLLLFLVLVGFILGVSRAASGETEETTAADDNGEEKMKTLAERDSLNPHLRRLATRPPE